MSVPVDIFNLATRKGLKVVEDLSGATCQEGQLVPVASGSRVRLRSTAAEARKRFSLAHEIGHTFFYKDEGVGPRHVIGVLNAAERNAEEGICNLFANALLMPRPAIHKQLQEQVTGSSSAIVWALRLVASRFRVSMPALLMRVGSLELEKPTCLLIWSSFGPSPRKLANPKLRIEFSLGLGDWSNRRFWNGTPVAEAGVLSALRLYQIWKDKASDQAGQFAISTSGTLDQDAIPTEFPESTVTMSTRIMGLWKRETLRRVSASALYSWKKDQSQSSEYMVTAIVPVAD
jgi:IrrE N-terminal-like domain